MSFSYRRGEPIVLDLVATDAGSFALEDLSIVMRLKKAANNAPPPRSAPAAATFQTTFTAATGEDPAFWRGTIAPAASADLEPGTYVTDAEITLAGAAIAVSEPMLIRIGQSITPA